jgi:arylsulfatase A-like enzyme
MNIVWFVIDCLRADRLGCYGYHRNTSPHLDRLAAESVRFQQCISPHIPTQPAHTTMFSGKDVLAHQIVAQGGRQELDPQIRLLPDLLREAGYFTGAVDNMGRWFAPAFEQYVEYPRWNHDGSQPWRNGEQVSERGLALLEAAHQDPRPFFLFLHFWDPHTPYLPPSPFHRMFYGGHERDPGHRSMAPVWQSQWFANYFSEWLEGVTDIEFPKAQYDASIAYSDVCLSHLLNRLWELGHAEDTLLLVTADHGEELDDHGCWFDHHGLYDTNVHVPLLIRFPGGRRTGTVPEMVTLMDLPRTLLTLLGLEAIAEREGMMGRSLLPLIEGNREPAAEGVYLTECTWMRKVGWRTPEWKLIVALEGDIYQKPPVELYYLPEDPGEQRNLATQRPEVVAALRAQMEAWVARRLEETGLPDPSHAQADALRIWQPRFIAGKRD